MNDHRHIELASPSDWLRFGNTAAATLMALAALAGVFVGAGLARDRSAAASRTDGYATDIAGIHATLESVETDAYEACMAEDAPGTADSKERWVAHCRAAADLAVATEIRFFECMGRVPRTADAAEAWADYCRTRADLDGDEGR